MNCQIKQGNINKEDTEVLVLGSYEDDKTLPKNFQVLDKALGGQLQELRKSGEFIGKNQQSVLIHTRGIVPAKRILFMGLGKKKEVTLDSIRQAMGSASKKARQTGAQTCSAPIMGTEALNSSASEIAQAMVEGAILGNYRFNYYRSDNGDGTKNIKSFTNHI